MDKFALVMLCCLTLYCTIEVETAPKVFSCMSYMEDDRTLIEDDDDDSEESVTNYKINVANAASVRASSYPNTDAISDPSVDVNTNIDDKKTASLNQSGAHLRTCPTDYTFCFALWRETSNGSHIEKQGCWKESNEDNATCSSPFCTTSTPTSRNNSLYYCCCSGEACNDRVLVSVHLVPTRMVYSPGISATPNNTNWSTLSLWLIVIAAGLVVTSLVSFLCYCQSKRKLTTGEAPLTPTGPGYSSNLRNVDNLNLISMLGNGKYGTVMKGLLHNQEVAVKIFPEAHQQYFINERNIYSLPLMDSPALLTYYGYDERQTLEGKMEYHLVLSLAPLGNLQDWLIANTVNFETFCSLVKSITRGLSHLHTEMKRGDMYKPCVAHRDLNTRNILVKADGACCISDFGFALKVLGSRYEYKGEIAEAETKSINEVGTLRYMAPELLEGAVNLRDCETSLKQMDVYALGLILWEVAMRCTDFYPVPQITPPYKAPYEVEVGSHPTFDQMQSLVVRHKARPLFPNGWNRNCAAKLIKDTCEDCWDHDAEARLTSLCAEERMHEMANIGLRSNHNLNATTPLLNANNLSKDSLESSGRSVAEQFIERNDNFDTSTLLNAPPNQKIMAPIGNRSNGTSGSSTGKISTSIHVDCNNSGSSNSFQLEKNHLIQPKSELQPYQGHNPSMERNLVRIQTPIPQPLIQRSKKHSFQLQNNSKEYSLSCLEEDVSVEELIAGRDCNDKTFSTIRSQITSNMGQGFPKQHNTDRNLKGWYGVRALIQKRLFRKPEQASSAVKVFRHINGGDEKLILVDNRQVAENNKILGTNVIPEDPVAINFTKNEPGINCDKNGTEKIVIECNGICNGMNKRPNNLDLSPNNATIVNVNNAYKITTTSTISTAITTIVTANTATTISTNSPHTVTTSNSISTIVEEEFDNINNETMDNCRLKSLDQRESTPSHVALRPKGCTTYVDTMDNNSIGEIELNLCTMNSVKEINDIEKHCNLRESKFRKQRSLEVFREVFNGRGSNERLRDPSQRVKTPGDVPPSVRKVRSAKTLSLYDDRMMDSSTLNIL